MANRYAVQSGNWSSLSTWDGGQSLPGVGDVVRPNAYAVTIDQDIEVSELRADASSPAVSGGSFIISSIPTTRNITASLKSCQGINTNLGTTGLVFVSATSGTLNIVGDIAPVTGSTNSWCLVLFTSITVNITGDIVGGPGSSWHAVEIQLIGVYSSETNRPTINVDGSVYGSPNNSGRGINCSNNPADITVTGNVYGSTGGGGGGRGIDYGGNNSTITVAGDVVANTTSWAVGIFGTGAGAIIDIGGEVIASASSNALSTVGTQSVRIRGPIRNAANGRSALISSVFVFRSGELAQWDITDDSDTPISAKNYVAASPPPTDVRSGTAYGLNNSLRGTLVLPSVSSVASGVSVGAGTGVAALAASNVWDHEVSTDVMAKDRLLRTATDASIAAQIGAVYNG